MSALSNGLPSRPDGYPVLSESALVLGPKLSLAVDHKSLIVLGISLTSHALDADS